MWGLCPLVSFLYSLSVHEPCEDGHEEEKEYRGSHQEDNRFVRCGRSSGKSDICFAEARLLPISSHHSSLAPSGKIVL
jgi:hypothetical protein